MDKIASMKARTCPECGTIFVTQGSKCLGCGKVLGVPDPDCGGGQAKRPRPRPCKLARTVKEEEKNDDSNI